MEVSYVDHMGGDARVVDAARVSFSKLAENYTPEQNERLITYLAKHGHFTPFTHCTITLREKVPIFIARQRFKHTVGFTYNEVSRRYVDDEPTFYVPDVWRKRAENKKQGSSDTEEVDEGYLELDHYYEGSFGDLEGRTWNYEEIVGLTLEWYNNAIDNGVAPEQARMILPQSMYTTYVVTGSLMAFARAYKLRSEESAQKEIQDLAEQWDKIIRPLYPVAWGALVDGN